MRNLHETSNSLDWCVCPLYPLPTIQSGWGCGAHTMLITCCAQVGREAGLYQAIKWMPHTGNRWQICHIPNRFKAFHMLTGLTICHVIYVAFHLQQITQHWCYLQFAQYWVSITFPQTWWSHAVCHGESFSALGNISVLQNHWELSSYKN